MPLNASDWITLAGVVIASLGFAVLFVQLWGGLRLLKADLLGRVYGELHEIHRAFIAYPDLRPHFYHGAVLVHVESGDPKLNNSEKYYRARALAEMFFDIFEHVYLLRTELTSGLLARVPSPAGDIRQNWIDYIDDMIQSSSFLASYLLEVQGTIHPDGLKVEILASIARHWPEVSGEIRDTKPVKPAAL